MKEKNEWTTIEQGSGGGGGGEEDEVIKRGKGYENK